LLDVAAITTFLNGNTGYVVTVYGQKGVFDMEQSSASLQPVFSQTSHRGGPGMSITAAGGEFMTSGAYNKTTQWCQGAAFENKTNPTGGNASYILADLSNIHAWMGLVDVGSGNSRCRVFSGADIQVATDVPAGSGIVLSARVDGAISAICYGSTVNTGDAGATAAGVPASIGRSVNFADLALGTCWWRANNGATNTILQTINAAMEALYA
jgi:hypothetical protein